MVSLCGGEEDGDADLPGLVDHIVGDAKVGEGDEAVRPEVQQCVVAPKGAALPSRSHSGFEYDLVDAVLVGQLAAIFSAPVQLPCSRIMSSYLILMLSRALGSAPARKVAPVAPRL